MGNIVNPTESALNSYIFSNALYPNFNKKPLLTRPQHSFNVQNIALQDFNNTEVTCIEIVLDMWDYMYTSRKVIDTVISYWPSLIYDILLCIQSEENEEMPEEPLICFRCANSRPGNNKTDSSYHWH